MNAIIQKIGIRVQTILSDESGQDLVEYALVVAMVAFAATAALQSLASSINTAFTSIGNLLTSYT